MDGLDLQHYDLALVRRAISVIFQDFVRYDLRFDENIGVGDIKQVRSYLDREEQKPRKLKADSLYPAASGNGHVPSSIIAAAEKSLAASLLPRFREGY